MTHRQSIFVCSGHGMERFSLISSVKSSHRGTTYGCWSRLHCVQEHDEKSQRFLRDLMFEVFDATILKVYEQLRKKQMNWIIGYSWKKKSRCILKQSRMCLLLDNIISSCAEIAAVRLKKNFLCRSWFVSWRRFLRI